MGQKMGKNGRFWNLGGRKSWKKMTFSTGKGSQSTRKCQKSTKELFYRTKNFWVFSTFSKKSEKMQKMTIFLIKKSQSEKCQKSKKSHE